VSDELTARIDVAQRVMDFTSARARALNTNLAHASEPGYRRVDVDFATLAKALRECAPEKREQALAAARPQALPDATATPGLNGNDVTFEKEQVEVDRNALIHQLAALMVNSELQSLRAAISGRS
jgi:flagellar basal-body rod protein FlgB